MTNAPTSISLAAELELYRKISVAEAAKLNNTSEFTFRRRFSHLICQVGERRQAVTLADAINLPPPPQELAMLRKVRAKAQRAVPVPFPHETERVDPEADPFNRNTTQSSAPAKRATRETPIQMSKTDIAIASAPQGLANSRTNHSHR